MDFQEVQQETSIANGIEASLPIIHRLHATPDFPYTAALLLCGHPIGNPAHSKGLRFWQLLEKVRAKLIEDCGMIHRDHRITNNTTEEIQLKKFVEKMAREFDAVFQYLETEFRKRTAAA
ncbi:MAG: hypothetical protein Q7S65_03640 [Nanoarchaeota archaeon]|nr:hypothetical protein [Nanoarchaeota archaeon]